MKKTVFFYCIFAIILIQNTNGQQLGEKYTDTNGFFNISMPNGWEIYEFENELVIIGPQDAGVTPNMGFGIDDYTGSASGYNNLLINEFSNYFSNFNLINRSVFRTNAGINGEYFTFSCTEGNLRLRMRMYAIPNKSGIIMAAVACAAPEAGGEKYDAVFDACIKTFNWIK